MNAKSPVVKVGDGRGFIVQGRKRLVITAAHCLPHQPPAIGMVSHTEERTYQALIGPIDGDQRIWAECLFADPIADLAVLGEPDNQVLSDQSSDYEDFTEMREPLPIGEPNWHAGRVVVIRGERHVMDYHAPARLLALDGQWFECAVRAGSYYPPRFVGVDKTVGGMSGSPIVSDGRAIAIVSSGEWANPYLATNLPGWLLHELG